MSTLHWWLILHVSLSPWINAQIAYVMCCDISTRWYFVFGDNSVYDLWLMNKFEWDLLENEIPVAERKRLNRERDSAS